MAGIIDFRKNTQNQNNESISLSTWLSTFHTDSELKEVFLNVDRAMKYVHERGYCVKTFDPKEIEILNNSLKYIKFNVLLKMPNDYSVQKEIIKEDIYNSAFIQIGIYSKCLQYLQPVFLKENFDSFATFLPEDDVPYYRGIVERGALVYLSEYSLEKRKRDLSNLENQIDGNSSGKGMQLVKSNGLGIYNDEYVTNSEINDNIYRQINTKNDSAFISFLVYPTIVLMLGVLLSIVAWIFSLL